MSLRNNNQGSIVKPGFNALGAQTNVTTTTYQPYLYSWGGAGGTAGRLGLGNTTNYSSPKQVGALTTWSILAAGGRNDFTVAIKTDGTLWAWGLNTSGQHGTGNTSGRSSPVQVGALTTWYRIAVGSAHTMAIKTDGSLWGWGGNASYGALGLGNTTNYSSPKQVGALTTWLTVAAGGEAHTLALLY